MTTKRQTALYVSAAALVIACLLVGLCATGGLGWWALARPTPTSTFTSPITDTATPSPISTATPVAIPSPLPTTVPTITSIPDSETTARHLRIFTRLWTLVRDNYLYPDYNGVDWNAIGEAYRTRIEAGLSDEDFWLLMDDMLRELNDDHSYFLSPDAVAEQELMETGTLDYVGVGFSASGVPGKGYAVILLIVPDSPAAHAGLRSHDRILEIDGLPACCDAEGYDFLYRLLGPEGSTVKLRVQTPGESPHTVTLTRRRIQSSLPLETRQLEGGIGYVLIPNLWDETLPEQMHQALEGIAAGEEPSGLIIDMRVNAGGSSTVLRALLSFFADGELGYFVSHDRKDPLRVRGTDVGGSQDVPLVILVGKKTASFGEVFSGVLQETQSALVVGRTTDGNVEILFGHDFEDGSQAWIAQETFLPPSGTDWEETGIVPDVEIPLDWDEFTSEDDPQLEAAVELLNTGAAADQVRVCASNSREKTSNADRP
jgi:C-terminal peptidase prc